MVSALTGITARSDTALTGELHFGVVCYRWVALKKRFWQHIAVESPVLSFLKNKKDLEELPEYVKESMEIITVAHMDRVLKETLEGDLGNYSECFQRTNIPRSNGKFVECRSIMDPLLISTLTQMEALYLGARKSRAVSSMGELRFTRRRLQVRSAHSSESKNILGWVKLVITPACHAGGRGFESRPSRHFLNPPVSRWGFLWRRDNANEAHHSNSRCSLL